MPKLHDLVRTMESRPDLVSSVDSWLPHFVDFFDGNFLDPGESVLDVGTVSESSFRYRLAQFLFGEAGARFMKKFVFDEGDSALRCGEEAPRVMVMGGS